MTLDTTFASKLESADESPAAFRDAMTAHLRSRDSARLFAYSPSFTTLGQRSPATVLAVTNDRWLIASDDADGKVDVDDCRFSNTLLVELTMILLYGQLKIDFVAGNTAQSSLVLFDTVMKNLYHEAVGMILEGVDGVPDRSNVERDESAVAVIETWPSHFRNSVPENITNGQRLLAATQWPAVQGGFGRELAPAAALLATDREIVLISDEKSWGGGRESKYGAIATHFPLVRLAKHQLHPHQRFTILDLEMHASHGGEKLQIVIPSDHADAVARVIGQVPTRTAVAR